MTQEMTPAARTPPGRRARRRTLLRRDGTPAVTVEQATAARRAAEAAAAEQAEAARQAAEERAAAERAAAQRATEAERAAAERLAAEREAAEAARRATAAAALRADAEHAAARRAAEAEEAARHRAAVERAAAELAAGSLPAPCDPLEDTGGGRHRAPGPALTPDLASTPTGPVEEPVPVPLAEAPDEDEAVASTPPESELVALPRADLGRGTAYSASMLLLLAAPLATLGAGYLAWTEPRPVTLGVTAGLVVLSAILVSSVRREATRVVVEDGVLDIRTSASHHTFDLRRPTLRIELHGRPHERRWQARVHRTGLAPFVIDGSMVQPAEFVRVLRECRPDVT